MLLFKGLRNWLLRRAPPKNKIDPDLSATAARDLGVRITRVRLPSGYEVVIIERLRHDEDQ
jgi:hypothetical protein